jgi:hypothetical protein
VFTDVCNLWIQNLMYIYISFILFSLLYYNYRFIYLYKGYASYRGYKKYKRLRTTDIEGQRKKNPQNFRYINIFSRKFWGLCVTGSGAASLSLVTLHVVTLDLVSGMLGEYSRIPDGWWRSFARTVNKLDGWIPGPASRDGVSCTNVATED